MVEEGVDGKIAAGDGVAGVDVPPEGCRRPAAKTLDVVARNSHRVGLCSNAAFTGVGGEVIDLGDPGCAEGVPQGAHHVGLGE